jgi:hypothetical protein
MGALHQRIQWVREDCEYPTGAVERIEDHRILAAYYAKALGITPEESAVLVLRSLDRTSRAQQLICINVNTSCRRNYRCIVCGSVLGRHSSKWGRTKKSFKECDEHAEYERSRVQRLMDLLGDVNPKLSFLRAMEGMA